MTHTVLTQQAQRSTRMTAPTRPLVLALGIESAITTLHHVYGAILDADMFRAHIVIVVLVAGAVTALLLRSYLDRPSQGRLHVVTGFVGLVYLGWLGLFEGGYNHALKDLVHLAGASDSTLLLLFPVRFEVPHDGFFEVTGVLTFVAALGVAWALRRFVRAAHRREAPSTE